MVFALTKRKLMGKPANSVIGIDLGKHHFKSVLLQRKGESRFVLTNFASRPVPESIGNADELAQQIKLLLKDIGGSAKGCALAASDPGALVRIIEQPSTPVELLRSALRLNGLAVLNQECRDFVLDCAPVSTVAMAGVAANGMAVDRYRQDALPRRRDAAPGCETDLRGDEQNENRSRPPPARPDLFLQRL